MSSFASLKATRASRQKPLASRDRASTPISGPKTESNGPTKTTPMELEASQLEEADPAAAVDTTQPLEESSSIITANPATIGEASVPVKGLPSYQDFPDDKLEIRMSKRSGRGMYVKAGSSVRKGKFPAPCRLDRLSNR